MKPLSNKAREGRANPKGIPYLYLSDDKTTALSELKPHPGQHLSLAEFETKKNLRIISCNANIINHTYARLTFSPPNSQKEISDAIWSLINDEFSAPIFNSDDTSDYAPTQILAELVKSHDYDGLQFKSSIGEGVNYILFNTDNANQINCKVMTTKSVSYEFSETDGHEYNQNIKQSL